MTNQHGILYRKRGLNWMVRRPGYEATDHMSLSYFCLIDINEITQELVAEDLKPFKLAHDFYSRVNKHKVIFTNFGCIFMLNNEVYTVSLPQSSDVTHYYTPDFLYNILATRGDYHPGSAKFYPIKNVVPGFRDFGRYNEKIKGFAPKQEPPGSMDLIRAITYPV